MKIFKAYDDALSSVALMDHAHEHYGEPELSHLQAVIQFTSEFLRSLAGSH